MSKKRIHSFGYEKTSIIDKFGVYLSRIKIVKFQSKIKNGVVLDIGCGYHANLLSSLQNEILNGIGIDVQINKNLNFPNIQLIESNIQDAYKSIEDLRFDMIFLISVLEHLENPLDHLQNCYNLLKKDGFLIINVPTWVGKFFLEFSAFKLGLSPVQEMNDHKMYYDKKDLWPLLIKAGFLPINLRLNYHKFGLNLFAVARKD